MKKHTVARVNEVGKSDCVAIFIEIRLLYASSLILTIRNKFFFNPDLNVAGFVCLCSQYFPKSLVPNFFRSAESFLIYI